jgi:hypothetical protein
MRVLIWSTALAILIMSSLLLLSILIALKYHNYQVFTVAEMIFQRASFRMSYIILLFYSLLLFFWMKFSITRSSDILLKLHLWNTLCKQLNTDDKVLHKVAGTFVLPWTKKQPFEYFLR